MQTQPTIQLPGQWSTAAPEVDSAYYILFWPSVLFFVIVLFSTIYASIRYKRRPGLKPEPTGHNNLMEIIWTVIPLIIVLAAFHMGFKGYMRLTMAPANTLDIRARAKKWLWEFEYPNQATEGSHLWVPVNKPVRVVLSSDDVLHSFFVPGFRVKHDAVPGSYSSVWFQAVQEGEIDLFCAEYCGTSHSGMIGKVHIVTQEAWAKHIDEIVSARPGETTVQWGERTFREFQCTSCHSTDGTRLVGPSFRGLFGRTEQLADGTSVQVDENYLQESIVNPQAKIVQGYGPVMPRINIHPRRRDALIQWIKTLH